MSRKSSSKSYAFLCEFCRKPFETHRRDQRFCSALCRANNSVAKAGEKAKQKRKDAQKKWWSENTLKNRERRLKTAYGITNAQYDEMLKRQEYKCFVCERPETDFPKRLAVDHDHKTGEIFGLLCSFCNRYILGIGRNSRLFHRAYQYLEKGGYGWFLPDLSVEFHRKQKQRNSRKRRK